MPAKKNSLTKNPVLKAVPGRPRRTRSQSNTAKLANSFFSKEVRAPSTYRTWRKRVWRTSLSRWLNSWAPAFLSWHPSQTSNPTKPLRNRTAKDFAKLPNTKKRRLSPTLPIKQKASSKWRQESPPLILLNSFFLNWRIQIYPSSTQGNRRNLKLTRKGFRLAARASEYFHPIVNVYFFKFILVIK